MFIVDAGTAAYDDYEWYTKGDKEGVFIKSNQFKDEFNGNLIGSVWPGAATFVDWFHPKAKQYWGDGLQSFHD